MWCQEATGKKERKKPFLRHNNAAYTYDESYTEIRRRSTSTDKVVGAERVHCFYTLHADSPKIRWAQDVILVQSYLMPHPNPLHRPLSPFHYVQAFSLHLTPSILLKYVFVPLISDGPHFPGTSYPAVHDHRCPSRPLERGPRTLRDMLRS